MIQIISNIFFTTRRNPFGAGTVFQFNNPRQFIFDYGSQSLWSRDGFSIYIAIKASILEGSQSLWSRDGFSMDKTTHYYRSEGRNPFGAGTVFQ